MLYNVSCITPAILCSLPRPLPLPLLRIVQHWAMFVPNVIAGSLFVGGSYSCWASAVKSGRPLDLIGNLAGSEGLWGYLLYQMVGSLARLLAVAATILISCEHCLMLCSVKYSHK